MFFEKNKTQVDGGFWGGGLCVGQEKVGVVCRYYMVYIEKK